ncbi:COMM domain-containing protein 8-like [Dysidea avara]|uniref:COMM domain-containing protein 8-like n=1 Tax=Dysidea avara TaxID=196820 RepID=UPI00332E967F
MSSSAIAYINQCDQEKASEVVHQVVDGVCGRESVRFENCAKLMSTSQFGQLKQALVEFVKESVNGEFNKANVQHKLTEEGVYPALAESIAECLSVRREELHEKLVQDSCAISHAHLVDCDWQVKLIMCSDKVGHIREPVLSLELDLSKNGQTEKATFELSKEELRKMISSLEAANKAVIQLKS